VIRTFVRKTDRQGAPGVCRRRTGVFGFAGGSPERPNWRLGLRGRNRPPARTGWHSAAEPQNGWERTNGENGTVSMRGERRNDDGRLTDQLVADAGGRAAGRAPVVQRVLIGSSVSAGLTVRPAVCRSFGHGSRSATNGLLQSSPCRRWSPSPPLCVSACLPVCARARACVRMCTCACVALLTSTRSVLVGQPRRRAYSSLAVGQLRVEASDPSVRPGSPTEPTIGTRSIVVQRNCVSTTQVARGADGAGDDV
jgi:hypothetical protein